jgi:hypothetical protein
MEPTSAAGGGINYSSASNLSHLPGGEFIAEGFAELAKGTETVAALLVAIGAPRLRRLGYDVPSGHVHRPEHRLYALLALENADAAHGRYNALIRRLVSFERAAACAR